MTKTMQDCQRFVDLHNKAIEKGKLIFEIKLDLKDQKVIKRTFKVADSTIKLNHQTRLDGLLKKENKYIEEEDYPYCPCKLEHILKNICPCEDCITEINYTGHCYCLMYVKTNGKMKLLKEENLLENVNII